MKYRELTREQTNALRMFADMHGRAWKAELRRLWSEDTWRTGHYPDLRSLRNTHGSAWLARYKLQNAEG